MTRYPAPRTRPATARPVFVPTSQYALFNQSRVIPPIRNKSELTIIARPSVTDASISPGQATSPWFSISPETASLPVGSAAKLRANLAAIETLKQIQQEQRRATPDEQQRLALYTGWGCLAALWKADEYKAWQQGQTDATVFVDESVKRWGSQYGRTRQRLSELLTPAEQTAAEASTLNAFYTAPEVVAAMWQAVDQFGFKGGRILEAAAGIGYFIGMMPPSLRDQSVWMAVEKDSVSGQILQLLYPEVETYICGLEQTFFEAASFDLVIGNVPFGSYTVYDREHPELSTYPIHNYFIARSMQLVKPGGLVALITSTGTLDAAGTAFRQFLTKETDAELLGAIRLPSNAFEASAGTVVTTDILFLRETGWCRPTLCRYCF